MVISRKCLKYTSLLNLVWAGVLIVTGKQKLIFIIKKSTGNKFYSIYEKFHNDMKNQ